MAAMLAFDLIADIEAGKTTVEKFIGLEACGKCAQPLQESVTGCRKVVMPDGTGDHYCSDCYFKEVGRELEDFPILPPRLRRRA